MLNQSETLTRHEEAEKYYNKGNSFYDLGKYAAAIEEYNKAIEVNPDYADAYNNKGNSLCEQERYEEALVEYNKAIELNPDDAKAYYTTSFFSTVC